jgi:intracellular multiplication protein IcmC
MLDINLTYLIEAFLTPSIGVNTTGTLGGVTISLDAAVTNLTNAFHSLSLLITSVSFVAGMFFIVKGVMGFKVFATQTMASAQKGEVTSHLVTIFIGAVLMYLPSTIDTSIGTLFPGETLDSRSPASDLIGYAALTSNTNWALLAPILVKYMDLIGLFAFVRGWFILAKTAHPGGGQPGQTGKGVIHIIAGILLMNIINTVNFIATTFGFSSS